MTPTAGETTAEKVVVCWNRCDAESISRIRKRFNIPAYTTLNGCSPAEIAPEDMPLFEETARRGYFTFMRADWSFNGRSYSWKMA